MKKNKKLFLKLALSSIFCFIFLLLSIISVIAETVSFFPKCDSLSCYTNPASAVISNDGSFVLVVDSSTAPYLKKYSYSNGEFTSVDKIPLNISNPNSSILQIEISKDNKQAVIYKNPERNTKAIILSVNLENKSVKKLSFYNSQSNDDIGLVNILTPDGNKIIAGNTNSTSAKLFIVNTSSDSIETTVPLNDAIGGVQVTPDSQKAVITYKGTLSQSVSIYNISRGELKTLNMPNELFFSLDTILPTKSFNLTGTKQVLASLGGKHVLYLLDLSNDKLNINILSDTNNGSSLPTIFQDGSYSIVASNLTNNKLSYKVYKVNLSNMKTEESVTFNDSNDLIDLKITPDQRKAFLLINKGSKSVLKIIDTNNLSLLAEYQLSDKKSIRLDLDPILIDPYGRYAIKSDSLSFINSSSSSSSTTSSRVISVCGNGSVEPGEECETVNDIVSTTSCTNCKLTCNKGTKKCNLNNSCTSAPANSNVAGTDSNCGCYCSFVQARKDGERSEY